MKIIVNVAFVNQLIDLGANLMNLHRWRKEGVRYSMPELVMDSTQDGQVIDYLVKLKWKLARVDDW